MKKKGKKKTKDNIQNHKKNNTKEKHKAEEYIIRRRGRRARHIKGDK